MTKYSATASASYRGTSTANSTATGNTLCEAKENAKKSALTSAKFALVPPPHVDVNQDTCKDLILSCIDFRFVDDAGYYMNIKGNCNNYDQFVLAGASLGYNGISGYENWILCCNQHINLSYELHGISEITIFDHLNCGGYKLEYTPEQLEGDGEFNLHVENLNKAEKTLKEKYSFLEKVNKIIFDLNFNAIIIP